MTDRESLQITLVDEDGYVSTEQLPDEDLDGLLSLRGNLIETIDGELGSERQAAVYGAFLARLNAEIDKRRHDD